MTKISISISLFVLILISSCTTKNNITTKQFTIFIPEQMQSTSKILDTAEIQYYNLEKNLYTAVEKLDIKRYPTIDSLCEDYIYSLYDNISKLDTLTRTNNSYKYKDIKFEEGGFDDSFDWIIRVCRTKKNYFIIWTWSSDKKYKKNKKQMKKITHSFKITD